MSHSSPSITNTGVSLPSLAKAVSESDLSKCVSLRRLDLTKDRLVNLSPITTAFHISRCLVSGIHIYWTLLTLLGFFFLSVTHQGLSVWLYLPIARPQHQPQSPLLLPNFQSCIEHLSTVLTLQDSTSRPATSSITPTISLTLAGRKKNRTCAHTPTLLPVLTSVSAVAQLENSSIPKARSSPSLETVQ